MTEHEQAIAEIEIYGFTLVEDVEKSLILGSLNSRIGRPGSPPHGIHR